MALRDFHRRPAEHSTVSIGANVQVYSVDGMESSRVVSMVENVPGIREYVVVPRICFHLACVLNSLPARI